MRAFIGLAVLVLVSACGSSARHGAAPDTCKVLWASPSADGTHLDLFSVTAPIADWTPGTHAIDAGSTTAALLRSYDETNEIYVSRAVASSGSFTITGAPAPSGAFTITLDSLAFGAVNIQLAYGTLSGDWNRDDTGAMSLIVDGSSLPLGSSIASSDCFHVAP